MINGGEDVMENKYKTAQVAKVIGIHPNTVRLYEKLGLIPKPQRLSNGYRVFSNFHIAQFKLARTALKVEVLQSYTSPLQTASRLCRIVKTVWSFG